MSRLYEFMKMSSEDEDIAKFRSISFKLVKESTNYSLELLDEHRRLDIVNLREELNTELKKRYNGSYRFDLCIDEGVGVEALKIKRKQAKDLSLLCHRCNDKLSKIKKNFEISLSSKKDI